MNCPDDGRPIEPGVPCRACRGFTLTGKEVAKRWPGVPLVAERRADAAPFNHPRACPSCGATMTPMRLHDLEAWVERCADCDLMWIEHLDVAVLDRFERRGRVEARVATMPAGERQEMAQAIAGSVADANRPLTLRQRMAVLGLPSVVPEGSAPAPVATIALAVLVLVGAATATGPAPGVDLYRPATDGIFTALLSIAGPSGWLHSLIAGYLVAAFGDGIEQRLGRLALVLLFAVAGAASILVEGTMAPKGAMVTGAAGAVMGVIGACVVLRPRARVTVSVLLARFEVPLLAVAVVGALVLGAAGLPGVERPEILSAWRVITVGPEAMAAGLVIGLAAGGLGRILAPAG